MFTKHVLSGALNPTVFWDCQYETMVLKDLKDMQCRSNYKLVLHGCPVKIHYFTTLLYSYNYILKVVMFMAI